MGKRGKFHGDPKSENQRSQNLVISKIRVNNQTYMQTFTAGVLLRSKWEFEGFGHIRKRMELKGPSNNRSGLF